MAQRCAISRHFLLTDAARPTLLHRSLWTVRKLVQIGGQLVATLEVLVVRPWSSQNYWLDVLFSTKALLASWSEVSHFTNHVRCFACPYFSRTALASFRFLSSSLLCHFRQQPSPTSSCLAGNSLPNQWRTTASDLFLTDKFNDECSIGAEAFSQRILRLLSKLSHKCSFVLWN